MAANASCNRGPVAGKQRRIHLLYEFQRDRDLLVQDIGSAGSLMVYHYEVKRVKYSHMNFCGVTARAHGAIEDSGAIFATGIYEVAAVAADGTALVRVHVSAANGAVDILSR